MSTAAVNLTQWAIGNAVPLHAEIPPLTQRIDQARVIFLGETDHFVAEKNDFRLIWLQRIARQRRLVVAEELGWSDGQRVNAYLKSGDTSILDTLATFGFKGDRRTDRDDQPTGVFRTSMESYPHDAMRRAHGALYLALRDLNIIEFTGFDIDAPGGGYRDMSSKFAELTARHGDELSRCPGESIGEEADRLQQFLDSLGDDDRAALREDLLSLIESLRYTELVNPAADYAATAPAMAYREQTMKRRIGDLLARLDDDVCLVLMGHAFHLAKDDDGIDGPGIGPGGNRVSSLGHHVSRDLGVPTFAAWMLMGGGLDSQPLVDLPQTLDYPADSLNRRLRDALDEPATIPLDDGAPLAGTQDIGHLYSMTARVDIAAQADAITFFPLVTPLV